MTTPLRRIDPLRGRPIEARVTNPGRFEYETVTVTTTSYTVFRKRFVLVDDDTAAGVVTITLPAAVDSRDVEVFVKKLGSTANVTVDGNASETIDGATTLSLTTQYQSTHLVCDGTSWHVV